MEVGDVAIGALLNAKRTRRNESIIPLSVDYFLRVRDRRRFLPPALIGWWWFVKILGKEVGNQDSHSHAKYCRNASGNI